MSSDELLISNHVKFYRKLNNLTQTELGKMIGRSDKTISFLECYYANPNFDICLKLAKLFGLDVSELFFEKGNPPEKRIVYIKKN